MDVARERSSAGTDAVARHLYPAECAVHLVVQEELAEGGDGGEDDRAEHLAVDPVG